MDVVSHTFSSFNRVGINQESYSLGGIALSMRCTQENYAAVGLPNILPHLVSMGYTYHRIQGEKSVPLEENSKISTGSHNSGG